MSRAKKLWYSASSSGVSMDERKTTLPGVEKPPGLQQALQLSGRAGTAVEEGHVIPYDAGNLGLDEGVMRATEHTGIHLAAVVPHQAENKLVQVLPLQVPLLYAGGKPRARHGNNLHAGPRA